MGGRPSPLGVHLENTGSATELFTLKGITKKIEMQSIGKFTLKRVQRGQRFR